MQWDNDGTGRTLLGVLAAIGLRSGKCEKIIVTRPAVSVDEQHGFLPGTLVEKMAPWTRPIFDVFEEYWSPQQIEAMITDGVIEIAPLAYMRGRTFKNCYIIADEMQNATPSQMKMLLTRIGTGSRIVVTGDLNQHDRGTKIIALKILSYLNEETTILVLVGIFEDRGHHQGIKLRMGTSNQDNGEVSAQLAHRVIREDYNQSLCQRLLVRFVNQAQRLVLRSQFYPQSKTHHY